MTSTLDSNLTEILSAYKSKSSLIANFGGTCVYDSARGWGRIWSCIYSLFGCCIGSKKQIALRKAVEKTIDAFRSKQAEMEGHTKEFDRLLRKKITRQTLDKDDTALYNKTCENISSWNDATKIFLETFNKDTLFKGFVEQHLKLEAFAKEGTKNKEIFQDPSAQKWQQYQAVIDLEGAVGIELPYAALELLTNPNVGIPREDESALEEWIKILNKENLDVHFLHHYLKNFVVVLALNNRIHSPIHTSVACLELALQQKNCTLFDAHDPEHLHWYEKSLTTDGELHYSDEISGTTKTVRLGGRCPEEEHQQYSLIENQNDPHTLVLVGLNSSVIGIKSQLSAQRKLDPRNHPIPPIKFHYVDPEGTFAIIEKLENLEQCDSAHLPQLIDLLKRLKPSINTSISFDLSHIKLNQAGELTMSLDALFVPPANDKKKKQHLTFNELEDFAYKNCNGDANAVTKIMKESGLSTHPCAESYQGMVEHVLDGEDLDVHKYIVEVKKVPGTDAERALIEQRGKELVAEITRIRNSCSQSIADQFPTEFVKFAAQIPKQIQILYKAMNLASKIPSSFEQLALNAIILKIKGVNPSPRKQEEHKEVLPKTATPKKLADTTPRKLVSATKERGNR